MHNYIMHHDDWSWSLPSRVVEAYLNRDVEFSDFLRAFIKRSRYSDDRLLPYACFRVLGLTMSRKGKSDGRVNVNGSDSSRTARGGDEWKWVNIKLSDEDIATLGQSDATLEYVAVSLVALAGDGLGFSVKPTDEGKSICCTIYRPDFPLAGRTLGVSSFSDNVRDAILACIYKLDTYGGGDFSGFDVEDRVSGARPRFR